MTIRPLPLLTAALALTLGAASAFAGECPADARVPAGQGQKAGATAPKDVTDKVLATIDLSKEKVAVKDRQFRMRELVVQPGGIVPWHDHGDRPAIIFIVSGEITEFASTCRLPIVHKAGEVSHESIGLQHWWKNEGRVPAKLISADIFHVPGGDKHMM